MKNLFYTGVGITSLAISKASFAAIDFGNDSKLDTKLQGSTETVDVAGQKIVGNFMLFLGVIAVLYGLWGGFNILTAGGDEEKMKTGKTVLIQSGIGLVVIFLANSVVQWVIKSLFV